MGNRHLLPSSERFARNPKTPFRKTGGAIRTEKRKRVSYVTTDIARNILDRADFDPDFELLVLNLQGYEDNALEGLDFDIYRPTFILAKVGTNTRRLANMPRSYSLSLRQNMMSDQCYVSSDSPDSGKTSHHLPKRGLKGRNSRSILTTTF